ncbi:hypothetical protein SOASR030_07310 [Leminorella grimontii]|uniref:Uncharacterized protein n=1 Tax=Leminorella grimontii TaxID=82981 RepID=A0AAV5N0E4_9GAMM|nr:hypothetical protein SOASR030_07310 [Leminorella grimontii]
MNVGLQRILDHVAVDNDVKGIHKVVNAGANQNEGDCQGLSNIGPKKQAKNNIQQAKEHYRHGDEKYQRRERIDADDLPGLSKKSGILRKRNKQRHAKNKRQVAALNFQDFSHYRAPEIAIIQTCIVEQLNLNQLLSQNSDGVRWQPFKFIAIYGP